MNERERLVRVSEAALRDVRALRAEVADTMSAIRHTREMFDHLCQLADMSAEYLLRHEPEEAGRGLVSYLDARRTG